MFAKILVVIALVFIGAILTALTAYLFLHHERRAFLSITVLSSLILAFVIKAMPFVSS